MHPRIPKSSRTDPEWIGTQGIVRGDRILVCPQAPVESRTLHRSDTIQVLQDEIAQLKRAIKELEVLKDLAIQAGSNQDLDSMLRSVVDCAAQAVDAREGVISLVDDSESGNAHTLARVKHTSTTRKIQLDTILVGRMLTHQEPLILNSPQESFPDKMWDAVQSLLCVPLVARSRLIGVLAVFNKRSGDGFTAEDQRFLTIIAAQSAQLIESAQGAEQHERLVGIFGQHVAPAVVLELMEKGADIESCRSHVSVMFLDIRGFSTMSEKRSPEAIVSYLNQIYEIAIGVVHEFGGSVRQLLGDGFMAMFGAPLRMENCSKRAVEAALQILEKIETHCQRGELEPTRIAIGIHSGLVVAGTVGSSDRKEYQVTGDTVNIAARIEQLNRQYDSQLLVSEATWREASMGRIQAREVGAVPIRGREEPVILYRLA